MLIGLTPKTTTSGRDKYSINFGVTVMDEIENLRRRAGIISSQTMTGAGVSSINALKKNFSITGTKLKKLAAEIRANESNLPHDMHTQTIVHLVPDLCAELLEEANAEGDGGCRCCGR
jgi:hypothetical protein